MRATHAVAGTSSRTPTVESRKRRRNCEDEEDGEETSIAVVGSRVYCAGHPPSSERSRIRERLVQKIDQEAVLSIETASREPK